jgi:hypothetical protein
MDDTIRIGIMARFNLLIIAHRRKFRESVMRLGQMMVLFCIRLKKDIVRESKFLFSLHYRSQLPFASSKKFFFEFPITTLN